MDKLTELEREIKKRIRREQDKQQTRWALMRGIRQHRDSPKIITLRWVLTKIEELKEE